MKKMTILGLCSTLAMLQLGCATTNSHTQSRVPDTAALSCHDDGYKAQSAWFHGQGAPAGQAQIGYGRSLEELNKTLHQRVEHASHHGESCVSAL